MSTSRLNARLKRWPGWVVLIFAVVALLAVGVTQDSGPQTPEERITALEKRLACPVCQGESVYESRNTASVQIRELIRQGVEDGELSDQQIIDDIVTRYNGEELLVPTTSGVEALAWALPATVAGLIWKWLFLDSWGALNAGLYSVGLIDNYIPWLTTPGLAQMAVVVVFLWTQLPLALSQSSAVRRARSSAARARSMSSCGIGSPTRRPSGLARA